LAAATTLTLHRHTTHLPPTNNVQMSGKNHKKAARVKCNPPALEQNAKILGHNFLVFYHQSTTMNI
jgi:hypothetical protein